MLMTKSPTLATVTATFAIVTAGTTVLLIHCHCRLVLELAHRTARAIESKLSLCRMRPMNEMLLLLHMQMLAEHYTVHPV